MQSYKIIHRTYYNFSSSVWLEPHMLRLRPRESHELRIETSKLEISPEAKLRWYRDVEDNCVARATFDREADRLAIESEVIIQQYNQIPLDFLVADHALNYPFQYEAEESILLEPYLRTLDSGTGEIEEWASGLWDGREKVETFVLLERICHQIHDSLTYQQRKEAGVQKPANTLTIAKGSCRDFAMLFMETARYLGLAARFVSGYLNSETSTTDYGATHAWAEVYLPGAGWKGFDPTVGRLADKDHIPVAVARVPEAIPPVEGTFVGGSGATMDVGVWVSEVGGGPQPSNLS